MQLNALIQYKLTVYHIISYMLLTNSLHMPSLPLVRINDSVAWKLNLEAALPCKDETWSKK